MNSIGKYLLKEKNEKTNPFYKTKILLFAIILFDAIRLLPRKKIR